MTEVPPTMNHSRAAKSTLVIALAATLSACGGGSSGGPMPPPTTAPTQSGGAPTAYTCPSSLRTASVIAAAQGLSAPVRRSHRVESFTDTGETSSLLTVTYRASVREAVSALDARVRAAGAQPLGTLDFDRLGTSARIIHVSSANAQHVASDLRAQPGVLSVNAARRIAIQRVSAPFETNDPFFRGVAGSIPPLYQTSTTEGQWDMHVIGLDDAFAYSQANNGSGIVNANALGSTSVRLAIVDTGADLTHPDLSGASVARSQCYITDAAGTSTSTGTFVTDPLGHGTDVTGIAASTSNNAYGFTGAAGRVSLMLYRVFPTPIDACANDNSTDPQCSAWDIDIASAINDAVQNGANVINISLGAGTCVNGQDSDSIQGSAIANAIAHNVIVVAAAGNGGKGSVSAPGCDPGVIAAGASAWNDGQPNGSQYTGGNSEYVASYSNHDSSNTFRSASSWGIVAPGGDANGSGDNDNVHWIENIWTTTPYQSSPTDTKFTGACGPDPFGETGNCRTFIDGTSMATPHVAGAAALVLAVNPSYGSPAAMKHLLCGTADDIGDPNQGCGRLNVYRALAKAVGDPSGP